MFTSTVARSSLPPLDRRLDSWHGLEVHCERLPSAPLALPMRDDLIDTAQKDIHLLALREMNTAPDHSAMYRLFLSTTQ